MRKSRQERGAGKIGTIIGLVVLALVIYALIVYIPLRVKVYEFRDQLEQQARYLASDQESWDARLPLVKEKVQLLWKESKLGGGKPLTDEQIRWEKGSSAAKVYWKMALPVKTFVKEFKYDVDFSIEAPFI
jgi:hypothetical protein